MTSLLKNHWKKLALGGILGSAVSYTYNDYQSTYFRNVVKKKAAAYGDKWVKNTLEEPRHLTVIINNEAGRKRGRKIFRNDVEPLLHLAGIEFSVVETGDTLQAKDMGTVVDPSVTSGVLLVGGSGLFQEFVSGLMKRKDWKIAKDMPLSLIPTGQNNGFVSSYIRDKKKGSGEEGDNELYNLYDAKDLSKVASVATLAAIEGKVRKADLMSVTALESGKTVYAFNGISMGSHALLNEMADRSRWSGRWRYNIAAVMSILRGRSWNVEVEYLYPGETMAKLQPIEKPEETTPSTASSGSWWWSTGATETHKEQGQVEVAKKITADEFSDWNSVKSQMGSLNIMNVCSFGERFLITKNQVEDSGTISIVQSPPLSSPVDYFMHYEKQKRGLWQSDVEGAKEVCTSDVVVRSLSPEGSPFTIDGENFEFFDIHVKVLPQFLTLYDW
eukprot:Nk52_evm4s236 gene=Nk52_evmTU4s236